MAEIKPAQTLKDPGPLSPATRRWLVLGIALVLLLYAAATLASGQSPAQSFGK
jgi:hypothetical protein